MVNTIEYMKFKATRAQDDAWVHSKIARRALEQGNHDIAVYYQARAAVAAMEARILLGAQGGILGGVVDTPPPQTHVRGDPAAEGSDNG